MWPKVSFEFLELFLSYSFSGNDEMPPFMREFVMRRSQQHSSPAPAAGATPGAPPVSTPPLPPNGGTPSGCPLPSGGLPSGWGSCENTPTKIRKPTPQIRPQSAFIPPGMCIFFLRKLHPPTYIILMFS